MPSWTRTLAPTPARPAGRALPALVTLALARAAAAGPSDGEVLRKSIDILLGLPPLASAHVSAEVVSLDDGQVLYARNADDQLNPASNTKLVTSAAALLRLGPEYRFTTDVLADRLPLRGRVGTLYVRGRGDPSITTERLEGLAADLRHRGLREVGDIVLDDTYFDREPWGPGWEQESSDKAYAAPVGALSLNHNSVAIYVAAGEARGRPARVELEPEARGYFVLDNRLMTVKASARRRIVPHAVAEGEQTRLVVTGRVPENLETAVLYRRVTDPTFYFGHVLKDLLQEKGIRVRGRIRRAAVPEGAVLLNAYDSPELAEIVRDMNKVSSNFIAEMLVKGLGAELRGSPGTWAKGLEVAEDLLAELGLPRGTYQLRNGSGLNDTNRFSAHQMTSLLVAVWKRFPVAAEFVSSLGIAARDGTLRLRMEGTDAAGRLRAKTGTLDKVTALSGYVQSLGGERFVFSLLVNDWSGRQSPVVQSVDRFGGLLAAIGAPEPTAREAALLALAATQPVEAPPAELKARIATYAALAKAADKKNLPFLRTALRTERDPLLRIVAADALYRTDPDGGGGALLETLPLGPEAFLRLRSLERELSLPVPIVPSLLDLAAEGSADALARILALAPLARGPEHDEQLENILSEGLLDVGDAAAEEMIAALENAPPAQGEAAMELVAAGLAQASLNLARFPLAQALRERRSKGGVEGPRAERWLALIDRPEPPVPASAAQPPAAASPQEPAQPPGAGKGGAQMSSISASSLPPASTAKAAETPAVHGGTDVAPPPEQTAGKASSERRPVRPKKVAPGAVCAPAGACAEPTVAAAPGPGGG